MTKKVLTVEDLNPRSRAVTSMVTAIRRAVLATKLVAGISRFVGEEEVYDNRPQALGGSYATMAQKIWGEQWRMRLTKERWQYVVSVVQSGSMRRQIEDMMACLPSSVREKLMGELEWDDTSTR